MKTINLLAILFLFVGLMATSCSKTDENTDPTVPTGDLELISMGDFVAQNDTPTAGTVRYGTDDDGVYFLEFGSDFKTELATGTVSIYYSTSDTFVASPGTGNPDLKLVGNVQANGTMYIRLGNTAVNSKFTHLILWCNTAGVPFGYAALQ